MKIAYFLFLLTIMVQTPSFKEKQKTFSRVRNAYAEKEEVIKTYFTSRQLPNTGYHLFIRIFKQERVLEAWVRPKDADTYTLLTQYDFCSSSGTLGPKRREGDGQIPEGIYYINHFNPASNFHLSLGLNYPNKSDKILGDQESPGSAIYIHGNCVTIGCVPITDDKIKELYILAVEARNNGQTEVPIHVFPSRMTESNVALLKQEFAESSDVISFWENLKPLYQEFEKNRVLRKVTIDDRGLYHLQ